MDNQQTEGAESARQKIAAKIKALLAKTTERGCSESEAIAAAQKAAELMAAYNLNVTEAELLSEGFGEDMFSEPDHKRFVVRGRLDNAIAVFTDTKIWGSKGKETHFLGLTSDVVFARFLHDSLTDFVMRHAEEFTQRQFEREAEEMGIPLHRAQRLFAPQAYGWWESFSAACAKRISERLREAKRETRVKGAESNALVALDKTALVDAELKRRGITLYTVKTSMKEKASKDALAAGKVAGDAAGFDKPVNSGRGKPKMLPNGRNVY